MCKIRLLILLLTSIIFIGCNSSKNLQFDSNKFKVAHIKTEYSGLLLSNYLTAYLKSTNNYADDSKFIITGEITHNRKPFITNKDNTSDREQVTSTLQLFVNDNDENCQIYIHKDNVEQFYIYAPSSKLLSNKNALKKIERDNTEVLASRFINILLGLDPTCKNN